MNIKFLMQLYSDTKQEDEFVDHILKLQTLLYSLSTCEIRKLAYSPKYVIRNGILNLISKEKKCAGYGWLHEFLETDQELSVRISEKTSISRIVGFNRV